MTRHLVIWMTNGKTKCPPKEWAHASRVLSIARSRRLPLWQSFTVAIWHQCSNLCSGGRWRANHPRHHMVAIQNTNDTLLLLAHHLTCIPFSSGWTLLPRSNGNHCLSVCIIDRFPGLFDRISVEFQFYGQYGYIRGQKMFPLLQVYSILDSPPVCKPHFLIFAFHQAGKDF